MSKTTPDCHYSSTTASAPTDSFAERGPVGQLRRIRRFGVGRRLRDSVGVSLTSDYLMELGRWMRNNRILKIYYLKKSYGK